MIELIQKLDMLYRETLFQAGQYYHRYNRGNNRQDIFFEREQYNGEAGMTIAQASPFNN